MEKDKMRIVEKVPVHMISDGNGEVKAMLYRDPLSKKHLFYLVKEGSCDDMAMFIQTEDLPK